MRSFTIFLLLSLLQLSSKGQRQLTLNEVLEIAVNNSIYAKLASTSQELALNVYQNYKSDLRPQISFAGKLPGYTRAYTPVTQPDGTINFLPLKQNYSYAGFSLAQPLTATGGTVSVNTSLSRFDDFNGNFKQYSTTPIYIALSQPLAGYNALKWAKKIEPLRYAEAQKKYPIEIEGIKQKAAELFFNVIEYQNDIWVSKQNLLDYRTNYEIEQKRIVLATTDLDRITQLELQVLEAERSLQVAQYQLKIAQLNLKVFIGWTDRDSFQLVLPELKSFYYPDIPTAIATAKRNRPEFIAFQRKELEAQSEVSKAKAAKYEVNVAATLGFNNSDARFKPAYEALKSQQTLGIEFDIPIVDWGRRNAKISTAKANLRLQEYQNNLDEITLSQEITTLGESLVLLQNNVIQAQKVQQVADKRYQLAQEMYQSGKYSITELTIAQNQKDDARKRYIAALKAYWDAHFSFRKQTGYRPENQ